MWEAIKAGLVALLEKLNKSELWVSLAGGLAVFLAPKLNLPVEQLADVILGIVGIVITYVGGRSAAKAMEARGDTGLRTKITAELIAKAKRGEL